MISWFLLVIIVIFCLQEAADAAKSAMVSVIGLDSEKVQQLCDAANQEVDVADKVQIANYLCPVRFFYLSRWSNELSLMLCLLGEVDMRCLGREIMQYLAVSKEWK